MRCRVPHLYGLARAGCAPALAVLASVVGCGYAYDGARLTEPYLEPEVYIDRPFGVLANGKDKVVITVQARLAGKGAETASIPSCEIRLVKQGEASVEEQPLAGVTCGAQWALTSNVADKVGITIELGTAAGSIKLEHELRFVTKVQSTIALSAPVTLASPMVGYGLASGDFTGDGTTDLAVANWLEGRVSLLAGSATGLAAPVSILTQQKPRTLAAADVDGDGIVDLAVGHSSPITLLSLIGGRADLASSSSMMVGSGQFQPTAIGLGDVNGDGRADLVWLSATVQKLGVYLNNGGALQDGISPYPTDGLSLDAKASGEPATALGLAVGRLDGDVLDDVVVLHEPPSDHASIWLGAAEGLRHAGTWPVGSSPNLARIVDLDSPPDGINELVVLSTTQKQVRVLRQQGGATLTFAEPQILTVGEGTSPAPSALAVGDVNRDGIQDVVVANTGANSISILAGQADGTLATEVTRATGGGPIAVAIGDFDHDNRVDIVTADYDSGTLTLFRGE